MRKSDPKSLAVDLLSRSTCSVKVAAVLFDSHGIFAWGWNSVGPTGCGLHAEEHAISRANRGRLRGSRIAVAGLRRKTIVPSMPCQDCMSRIRNSEIKVVYTQDRSGAWIAWRLE